MNALTRPAAAILAGGRASRLGGIRKAALTIGGVRIIDRQLSALQQIAEPVFVVSSDDWFRTELGLMVLPDLVPGGAALGGIYTAIAGSPVDRTLVVACDMPFLSVPLFERMCATPNVDLVIPRANRGYEPLCALYTRACLGPIRDRLDRGEREASILPEGLRIDEIGPDALTAYDPHGLLFVNVNTPHDYERARQVVESVGNSMRDRIMDGT
jgi:molybdopterin-guanine dinucleotide biosynthesis protein A